MRLVREQDRSLRDPPRQIQLPAKIDQRVRPLEPRNVSEKRCKPCQHGQAGPYGNPSLNCLPDGVPHADLLPEPFKIIQTPGEIVILYEVETIFRQVFTDGRKQLVDPAPTGLGYSVGRWDGDTLVVDTRGFNDRSWLDVRGHGHSEDMRVEERFRRRDYGHLDLTITITDPSGNIVLQTPAETAAGNHSFAWNGQDSSGSQVPDGTYTFNVSAAASDKSAITAAISAFGKVDGVSSTNGAAVLDIGGVSEVLGSIVAITS